MPKRRIITARDKQAKQERAKKDKARSIGDQVVSDVASFKRMLATAIKPESGVKIFRESHPFMGVTDFAIGDTVTHALDLNHIRFKVVGSYCTSTSWVYGCKAVGKKTLWFESRYLMRLVSTGELTSLVQALSTTRSDYGDF